MVSILIGFTNIIVNKKSQLSRLRVSACKKCFVSEFKGKWCFKANGGCGCYLPAKTSVLNEQCPKKVWDKESINEDLIPKQSK